MRGVMQSVCVCVCVPLCDCVLTEWISDRIYHPLYEKFLGRLSFAVFEWDPVDVALLEQVKYYSVVSLSGD